MVRIYRKLTEYMNYFFCIIWWLGWPRVLEHLGLSIIWIKPLWDRRVSRNKKAMEYVESHKIIKMQSFYAVFSFLSWGRHVRRWQLLYSALHIGQCTSCLHCHSHLETFENCSFPEYIPPANWCLILHVTSPGIRQNIPHWLSINVCGIFSCGPVVRRLAARAKAPGSIPDRPARSEINFSGLYVQRGLVHWYWVGLGPDNLGSFSFGDFGLSCVITLGKGYVRTICLSSPSYPSFQVR